MAQGGGTNATLEFMCQATVKVFESKPNTDATGKIEAGYCLGFVTGMIDSQRILSSLGKETLWCGSETMQPKTAIKTFLAWMKQNPKEHDMAQAIGFTAAMMTEFPCGSSAPTSRPKGSADL
jgi:hypothetical protein